MTDHRRIRVAAALSLAFALASCSSKPTPSPVGTSGTSSATAMKTSAPAVLTGVDALLITAEELGGKDWTVTRTKEKDDKSPDLCGRRFASDAMIRAQASVAIANVPAKVGATQQVAMFRPGGGVKALAEFGSAVAHCPKVYSDSSTKPATRVHDTARVPGAVKGLVKDQLVISLWIEQGTARLWAVEVVQRVGDSVSAIGGLGRTRAIALSNALTLAKIAARHLAQAP